jgi:putative spermidine/putrescine transport system permease protein
MSSRLIGPLVLFLVLTFLIGPFLIIIAASLSAGETLAFPPQGLSLRWVIKVFQVESFQASFGVSMFLAIGGTLVALLLGVPAAYALSRYKLPFAETIRLAVSVPIVVPGIIVGLALLRYLVIPFRFGILPALFFAHTALVLPYAVRVVSASLNNLRADIEEAAVLLGSTHAGAFFRVVMPNIRGGILAAFILGFVTSFNQVPVSLFLSGPGIRTLPIDMLAYMEIVFDPSIAALASLLAFMSIGIVFLAERFLGLSRYV